MAEQFWGANENGKAPFTLTSGLGWETGFAHEYGMTPAQLDNQLQGLREDVQRLGSELRARIDDQSKANSKRIDDVRDLIYGKNGIDARVESLEKDRDQAKNRFNYLLGAVTTLGFLVLGSVMPQMLHAIVKLFQ